MALQIIFLVSAVLLSAYFVFLAWLIFKIYQPVKEKINGNIGEKPGISLVIPFKNEAHNLDRLLRSLMRQNYRGPMEVILVNDGSQDAFREALAPFMAPPSHNIKLIDSAFDPQKRLTSKQQALDAGVAAASFEWIGFTDADMDLGENWLDAMTSMIPRGGDLVFGHTVIARPSRTLLWRLQAFQLEFLFAIAWAFCKAGVSGSCMGNNLLVRKRGYEAIGGQAGIGYSIVEDRSLLEAFLRKGLRIAPAEPFAAHAVTAPCAGIRGFCSQALRWARGGFTPGSRLLPIGILFTFHNLALALAIAGVLPPALFYMSVIDALLLMVFLAGAFGKIGSKEYFIVYPVYYLTVLLQTIGFLLSLVFMPALSWKSRKL